MLPVLAALLCGNWSSAFCLDTSKIYKDLSNQTKLDDGAIETVDALMNVGRYQRAITVLEKNSNLYKDRRMFLLLLICTYATRNARALTEICDRWCERKLSTDRNFDSIVYEFLGVGHVLQNDYKKAVDAFSKSIAIDARDRVIASRSAIKAEIANRDSTVAGTSKGSGAKVESSLLKGALRQELDMFLTQQADLPLIETLLEEGFSKSSPATRALVTQAERLEEIGQFKNARDVYCEASKHADFDSFMWNEYGLCAITLLKNQDDVLALESADMDTNEKVIRAFSGPFEKAVSMNASDWRLLNNLGLTRYWTRNLKGGWKEILERTLHFPETPAAQRIAIRRLFSMESTMEALKNYQFKRNTEK